MALSVNLLKKNNVLTEKQYLAERKVMVAGVVVFCMVLATMMLSFGWQLIVNAQAKRLDTQIAELTKQNASLSATNTQQLYIKTRLGLIGDFLNARTQIRESLQRVFAFNIPGVTVSGVSFDGDELRMQTVADSIFSFDKLYAYLEQDNGFFAKIVNHGTSRSAEGRYNGDLTLTLPKGETAK